MAIFARTGAGKGRSCTLPWLLHAHNPAIVLDVKGEAYHCTVKFRREVLGHRIHVLDPFGLVGGPDRLNPFDIVRPGKEEEDAEVLTELFLDDRPTSLKDPFWDHVARGLLLGSVAHVATSSDPSPLALRALLQNDDVVYGIAKLLDTKTVRSELARRELATFLAHESDKVRPSVLSTAQQSLRVLSGQACVDAMCDSTIDLADVMAGRDFTIYIVIPPENLVSHGPLLRLWVGTLLRAVVRREKMPEVSTLFLLDEVAQCGALPILRQAMTLLRGYGLSTITLWQDLAQMQRLYEDWRTLVNNCAVLQAFGASTWTASVAMSGLLGVPPERVRDLPETNALVSVAGDKTRELRRFDYLTDRPFRERAGRNPRFERAGRA